MAERGHQARDLPVYAGIEAGGTKVVCVIGSAPEDICAETRIPTTTPGQTLERILAFFGAAPPARPIRAVGIASFGPLELRPRHPKYGFITKTPKRGWRDVDLVGPIRDALQVPVAIDTDVNGAALAEGRWGAARALSSWVYVTVGTGIGGGAVVDGHLVHGMSHPELGHQWVPREPGDTFEGCCPYHGDCLEGLASGPALEARYGRRPSSLRDSERDQALRFEAGYLAAGVRNIVYALAPERVVLGGGVSQMPGLFPALHARLRQIHAYPGLPEHRSPSFAVPPALGTLAGALGALIIAERAALAQGSLGGDEQPESV